MTQQQSGIGSKSTGNTLTADEFNTLNISTVNLNAADAESRLVALEASAGLSPVVVATVGAELTDVNTSYDAGALGTATFTLPTPSAALNGAERFMYRTGAIETSFITITGNICGASSQQRVLGLIDEYVAFKCDGTTWLETGHSLVAFATLSQVASGIFNVTTGLTKFDTWDTLVFSTPGKLIADLANNQMDVLDFEGPVDGYRIECTITFEYTNNKIVTAQIAVGGIPVTTPVSVNALGTGKPVTIVVDQAIGITAADTIAIFVSSESAGALTSLTARMTVSRIKG